MIIKRSQCCRTHPDFAEYYGPDIADSFNGLTTDRIINPAVPE